MAIKGFVQTVRLRIGRCAILAVDDFEQILLYLRRKVRQLHTDGESDLTLVHQVEQFGDEVGQSNIALNLIAAFTVLLRDQLICSQLRPKLGRSCGQTKNLLKLRAKAEIRFTVLFA